MPVKLTQDDTEFASMLREGHDKDYLCNLKDCRVYAVDVDAMYEF